MSLFGPLITIFIIILFGIFCYKKQVFNKTQIGGFELFLLKIIMPCYLFVATYKNDLSELFDIQYILAYLISFGILSIIVTLFFIKKLSKIAICMRILASGYVNVAIYTLPVVTILLKDPKAAIIANIVQVIIIQPIFIIYLHALKYKNESLTKKIFSIITTPLIIMPIIGILLNYLQIKLPLPIVNSVSQISNGAAGISLFALGLTLGATTVTTKYFNFDLLSIIFAKNILHPVIAICVAYIMKLEGYWFNSLVIGASAPTAFLVYLISKEFSDEEELIKKTLAVTSLVSTISLIFITIIIGQTNS
jgi:predicted permease